MTSGEHDQIVDQVEKTAKHLLSNSLRLDPDFSKFAGMDWMEAFFEEVLPILCDRNSWVELIKTTAPTLSKHSLVIRLMEIFPVPRNHRRDTRSLREFHYFVVARHALIIEVMAEAIFRLKGPESIEKEKSNDLSESRTGGFQLLSEDFRVVRSQHGHEFHLSSKGASLIQLLWEARERGKPWVSGDSIAVELFKNEFSPMRVRDLLKDQKDTSCKYNAWKELVEGDSKGSFKLKV
jgi:hypothetical protein